MPPNEAAFVEEASSLHAASVTGGAVMAYGHADVLMLGAVSLLWLAVVLDTLLLYYRMQVSECKTKVIDLVSG